MLISAVTGLKAIEPELLTLTRSMDASAFKVFWMTRLPAALPSLFGAPKLAIALATSVQSSASSWQAVAASVTRFRARVDRYASMCSLPALS